MALTFEWDLEKAEANRKKHGVAFAEASTVFRDTLSSTISDPDHSTPGEARELTIGVSHRRRLIVVAHCKRGNNVRIINARLAENMKKAEIRPDEMRAEYDFSKGVRGKYAKQYAEGTNVVILEPDIAREFPTGESVNQALRSLIPVIVTHRKAVAR